MSPYYVFFGREPYLPPYAEGSANTAGADSQKFADELRKRVKIIHDEARRRAEEKRALKRQLTSGIVYHVGTTGSKLVYPRGLPGLPHKKGKTWDFIVRKGVKLPFR